MITIKLLWREKKHTVCVLIHSSRIKQSWYYVVLLIYMEWHLQIWLDCNGKRILFILVKEARYIKRVFKTRLCTMITEGENDWLWLWYGDRYELKKKSFIVIEQIVHMIFIPWLVFNVKSSCHFLCMTRRWCNHNIFHCYKNLTLMQQTENINSQTQKVKSDAREAVIFRIRPTFVHSARILVYRPC